MPNNQSRAGEGKKITQPDFRDSDILYRLNGMLKRRMEDNCLC